MAENDSLEYKQFKVVVKDDQTVEIIRSSGSPPVEGEIRLDGLIDRTIEIFSRWLANDAIKSRDELEVMGSYLFNVLFDNDTRKLFRKQYDTVQNSPNTGMRLILEFEEKARELAVLPWEYLYYPDNLDEGRGFFLAADDRLILTRHVPLRLKQLQPGPTPLRILLAVSRPARDSDGGEMRIVRADPVVQTIQGLKTRLGERVDIEILEQPTKKKLADKVRDPGPKGPFHVVHIVGHGKYELVNREEHGYLALISQKDPDRAAWIKDTDLADCFTTHPPRLIFLHACEGARSESYKSFRGVALQLVYSRIPAVVAMQYEVQNSVANAFAECFYQSIGQGKDIDVAVQDGRRALGGIFSDEVANFSTRAFGSPVVYMQTAAGIVIAESPAAEPVKPAQTQAPAEAGPPVTSLCPYCFNRRVTIYQNFCPGCRGALKACPNCGTVNAADASFCGSCGIDFHAAGPEKNMPAAAQTGLK